MTRTTILTCFDCRRPVGHTGLEDAVVHVSYRDIAETEAAQLAWETASHTRPCRTCRKPTLWVDGARRAFHVDGSDNQQCEPAAEMDYKTLSGDMPLTMPDPARWAVHCDGCNPHQTDDGTYCGGCYWFDAQRCRTWEQVASWTAHLLDKGWIGVTNWADFIRSLGPVDA